MDVERFVAECARLLRPGGVLVVSTDYWPERLDTHGLKRFRTSSRPDRVFDREGALELCSVAEMHGLRVVGQPQLDAEDSVIESDGLGYKFLFLVFERVRPPVR